MRYHHLTIGRWTSHREKKSFGYLSSALVADQQEPLSVTKAGPLDDASNVIEEVDGILIVDQPQHAVFKISRTRPLLGLRANQD